MKKIPTTLIALALAGTDPGQALADSIACGAIITADTVLGGDMGCAGTALVIGADGVTLDLGGHRVYSLDGTGFGVDNTGGYDGVTVKNGAIEGFEHCVITDGGNGFTAKDLVVLPGWDNGIHALNGDSITVKDLWIPDMPDSSAGVVFNAVTNGTVKDCEINGGFGGVAFGGGSDETGELASSGSVTRCVISSNVLGVLLAHANNVKVADNEISVAEQGVRIGSGGQGLPVSNNRVTGNEIYGTAFAIAVLNPVPNAIPLQATGLKIDQNLVHDNFAQGITLVNADDSVISDNVVTDNGGFGIRMFFSTGNVFKNNVATGHAAADMWATPDSTPNKWTGNTCNSSWGPDIDCP